MRLIKFPEHVQIRIVNEEIFKVIDPRGGSEEFYDCDEANEEALLLVEEIRAVKEARQKV
jgi:hypothetical protein